MRELLMRAAAAFLAVCLVFISAAPSGGDDELAHSAPPPAAAEVTEAECDGLGFRATLLKARHEMESLSGYDADDTERIGTAMDGDAGFSATVKDVFGSADVVKSEYSRESGCVVTVRLSVEKLLILGEGL